jgi:hypothetical protein
VPDFYVERALAAPLNAATERSLSHRLDSCARAHRVRWRECLVDGERQRIVCRVEAQDLPAARAAALCSGVEPDATWLSTVPHSATKTPGGDGNPVTSFGSHAALVDVMAECQRDVPIDIVRLVRDGNVCDWCLDTQRVNPGPVVASADGRRVVAFFRAPDAEAVRNAYRHAAVPFDRVVAVRRLDR